MYTLEPQHKHFTLTLTREGDAILVRATDDRGSKLVLDLCEYNHWFRD